MAQPELNKRPSGSAARDAGQSQSPASHPDPLDVANASRKPIRMGLWAMLIGLAGFTLWAAYAPLDEGVPSMGQVAVDTKRKAVQHLSGGIVKEVLVREGQKVKEGDVLIRLDEAATKASYETLRQQYFTYRAIQNRLQTEQVEGTSIKFAPDLLAAASLDPLIGRQISTQQQLFTSRRAQLRADLQAIAENVQGQQSLIQTYQQMAVSRREQQRLLGEQIASIRDLVKEGYAPRNQLLELERNAAENQSQLSQLMGNIQTAQSAIAELRQKSISRQQDYRKEVEGQLSDVTRQVESDVTKYQSLGNDLQRIDIKSPATGQVVGLAVQTVGGVVAPGQKLMDIVPDNETLLLEVRIPPNLIDRVHAGLPVDVRFSSFAHSPMLVVEGKVATVSGDLLSEPANPNIQYYLGRVALTPEAYKTLGHRQLQPGMPVEVVLKTGERSMLQYLIHPLTKRIAASMKEE